MHTHETKQANTRHSAKVVLMLIQRRRRWNQHSINIGLKFYVCWEYTRHAPDVNTAVAQRRADVTDSGPAFGKHLLLMVRMYSYLNVHVYT